jgi:hypothetical protein
MKPDDCLFEDAIEASLLEHGALLKLLPASIRTDDVASARPPGADRVTFGHERPTWRPQPEGAEGRDRDRAPPPIRSAKYSSNDSGVQPIYAQGTVHSGRSVNESVNERQAFNATDGTDTNDGAKGSGHGHDNLRLSVDF